MAGIRDVAKYAGVSPSTVSRALSGAAFVEPETKEKVLKAVSDLNYKPSLAARSLKRGGSRLIGLIIPDITNPYFPEAVKYMELRAAEAGYSLILCDSLGDVEKERDYFERLKYLFVDGILYIRHGFRGTCKTIYRRDSHGDCEPDIRCGCSMLQH